MHQQPQKQIAKKLSTSKAALPEKFLVGHDSRKAMPGIKCLDQVRSLIVI